MAAFTLVFTLKSGILQRLSLTGCSHCTTQSGFVNDLGGATQTSFDNAASALAASELAATLELCKTFTLTAHQLFLRCNVVAECGTDLLFGAERFLASHLGVQA